MSDPLPFEKVSVEDARKALESTAAVVGQSKAQEQDWRWARTYSPPMPLRDSTIAWLARLPPEVRPTELPAAYARIANRICELWERPAECEHYFEELTHDRRGRRNGFPGNIAYEIAALKKHHASPAVSDSLWDNKIYRR